MAEPAYIEGHCTQNPMIRLRQTRSETELLNSFYFLTRTPKGVLLNPNNKYVEKTVSVDSDIMYSHSSGKQYARFCVPVALVQEHAKQSLLQKFKTKTDNEYLNNCLQSLINGGYIERSGDLVIEKGERRCVQ